jgi:hypothetical protein
MRTLPDGSWVEIANYKKRLNTELRARAYFYEKKVTLLARCPGLPKQGSRQFFLPMLQTPIWAAACATASSSSVSNPQLACMV